MGDEAVNLRDQVAVVRRRWRIVALFTLLGLAAGLALALTQAPLYRASTRMELTPVNAAQTASNGLVMQPTEITTQIQVLLSTPVAQRVIDKLKLDTDTQSLLKSVTAEQESDTRVITVTALRSGAAQAKTVADAFASEYLTFRQEQAVEQNRAAVAALADEAKRVRARLAEIQDQIPGASGGELTALQSEQQALLVELTQILSDQATASVTSPAALGNGGQILVPATKPTSPAEPKPVRAGLLGAFIGLVLGVGLAFVRDHFDDGVRDEFRLREALAPRPVLGRIPHWTNARSGRLATVLEPASQAAEAYRALSTSIRFMLAVPREHAAAAEQTARTGKVLMVTSPMESEGKTSLASNLAVVAARFGLRVTLVDADLRNSQLADVFGLGRPPGLSDLLASNDSPDDYVIDVEDMRVLPGGSLAPNPAELLASPRMRDLLAELAEGADLVIIDTAPVTRVSDALELVGSCDLVLLVARHGQTRLRSVQEAIEKIHQVGGEVSGGVYVDVPQRSGADSYGYGYTADADAAEPPNDHDDQPGTPRAAQEPADAPAPARLQRASTQHVVPPPPAARRGGQVSLEARLTQHDTDRGGADPDDSGVSSTER